MNENPIYDRLRAFAYSKKALLIIFLWGFFEATFFFIVPDVFFLFICLFAPKRGVLHAMISVAGSLAGGLVMYLAASTYPEILIAFLTKIPLISQPMVNFVHNSLQQQGISALFAAPLKGIPYKIYAVQAAILSIKLPQFLIYTVPGRLQRMLLLSGIVALFAWVLRNNIRKHTKKWLVFYFLAWIAFYFYYAVRMSLTY